MAMKMNTAKILVRKVLPDPGLFIAVFIKEDFGILLPGLERSVK